MKTKSIKAINLPPKLPVLSSVVTWLCLDHWNAPQWGYAVAITLGGIVWAVAIWVLFSREYVDIFSTKK